MNTVTLHFKADNQQLTALDGLYKLASNTVEYVKAVFELGENWTGFDVVRAAWYTDFECISTVLDGNGECFVPWEVLSRPEGVTINLYGCDLEEESDGEAVLIDRLTTYPVKAILVDVDARVCGSETKPVTPSQFEQYIAIVEGIVHSVKDIDHTELNADYTLTIYYTDGTSDTVGPIRGEQGPVGPTGNGISKIEKVGTAGLVDTYRITYTNGQTYEYTVTNGAQGPQGNGIVSIYKSGESGAVKTYTILFTDGNTFEYNVTDGEVTFATLEQLMPKDTASGDIASFPDGQAVFPLKSCLVDIEPVQDLHGYDKPWVGGAGKNLIAPSAWNSSFYTQNADGTVNCTGVDWRGWTTDVLPVNGISISAGTYTVSTNVALQYMHSEDASATTISANSTSTFTISANAVIGFKITSVVNNAKIQLETGSSPTAWTPYSNICPITGRTGCEVDVAGVNLWDEEWESGSYDTNTGAKAVNANVIRCKNLIAVKPNTTYYICTPATARILYYDADESYLTFEGGLIGNATFTTPSKAYYIAFYCGSAYGTTYNNDVSINYPSTDHDYHAYNGTTYPVSWQTEAGTVYGGTVDVVTGVLTVDRVTLDLGTLSWVRSTTAESGKYRFTATVTGIKKAASTTTVANILSSQYQSSTWGNTFDRVDGTIGVSASNETVAIYDSRYETDTKENFKTAMNGVQLVYELATQQTYQLNPVQVACLLGQNNVWADCGAVEVEYVADTQLWVLKKLSE